MVDYWFWAGVAGVYLACGHFLLACAMQDVDEEELAASRARRGLLVFLDKALAIVLWLPLMVLAVLEVLSRILLGDGE